MAIPPIPKRRRFLVAPRRRVVVRIRIAPRVPPRRVIVSPRRRILWVSRRRSAFVQPNQTPPSWPPPNPYAIRQPRQFRGLRLARGRSTSAPAASQVVVVFTYTPQIVAARRRFGWSRRHQQSAAPPTALVTVAFIPSIKRASRRSLRASRRMQLGVPTVTVVVVSGVRRIRRGVAPLRRRQQPATPPFAAAVPLPPLQGPFVARIIPVVTTTVILVPPTNTYITYIATTRIL